MEYVVSLDHENKTQTMDFFKMYDKATGKPVDCKFIPYYATCIDSLNVYVAGIAKDGVEKYARLGRSRFTTRMRVDYANAKAYVSDSKSTELRSGGYLSSGMPDKNRIGMYLQPTATSDIYIKNVSDDGRSRQDGNIAYYYSLTPPLGQECTVLKLDGPSVKATLSPERFYDYPFGIIVQGKYGISNSKEYDFKVKLEGIESFEYASRSYLTIEACISELPIMFEFTLKSQQ